MVSETLLDSDVKVRRLAFDTISKLLDSLKPFAVPGIYSVNLFLQKASRNPAEKRAGDTY